MSLSIVDLGFESGVARHALRGDLTIDAAASAFPAGLARLTALTPGGRCDFDCGGIDASDSTGLAVLIEWQAEAQRRGLTLGYSNLPVSLARLARLSEVETLLIRA